MAEYHYFVAHEFSKQEKDYFRKAVENAFIGTGLRGYYPEDESIRTYNILNKKKEMIFSTKFGIYDISNYSEPNTFLELGLAMAADKTFYITCKKGSNIPDDLKGLHMIEYKSYRELTALIKSRIVDS